MKAGREHSSFSTSFPVPSLFLRSSLLSVMPRSCRMDILDSAVVSSRTCRAINCEDCQLVFEDVDVRKIELFRCRRVQVVTIFEVSVNGL